MISNLSGSTCLAGKNLFIEGKCSSKVILLESGTVDIPLSEEQQQVRVRVRVRVNP
jgi:NCAIR mutase (PurE)-related protein